jgi:hypothetical protein
MNISDENLYWFQYSMSKSILQESDKSNIGYFKLNHDLEKFKEDLKKSVNNYLCENKYQNGKKIKIFVNHPPEKRYLEHLLEECYQIKPTLKVKNLEKFPPEYIKTYKIKNPIGLIIDNILPEETYIIEKKKFSDGREMKKKLIYSVSNIWFNYFLKSNQMNIKFTISKSLQEFWVA